MPGPLLPLVPAAFAISYGVARFLLWLLPPEESAIPRKLTWWQKLGYIEFPDEIESRILTRCVGCRKQHCLVFKRLTGHATEKGESYWDCLCKYCKHSYSVYLWNGVPSSP